MRRATRARGTGAARAAVLLAPLLLLLASCGGGGGSGGGPPAIGLTFATGSVSIGEGGTLFIPVEIEILAGIPLAGAVTVTVTASGGTAAAGSDYAFSVADLTFPIGAAPGTQRIAQLSASVDARLEGTETVALTLTAMTGGAALGTLGSRTISILDANAATLRFQPGTSTTGGEGAAAHPVSVQLDLASGDTLDVALTLQIVDAFEGNASSGSDYQAIGAQTLSFPAGSGDGATASGSVTVIPDAIPEGDETVVLDIVESHPSLVVGSPASHTLTIEDDDASGGGSIQVEVAGSPIASGTSVALGAQPIASGPGSVVSLTVRNIGAGTLLSELPVIVAGDDYEFLVEYGSASPLPAPPTGALPVASPLIDTGEDPLEGVALIVDELSLAALGSLDDLRLLDVALPGGVRADLELRRLEAPWSPDAVISIDGALAPFDPAWLEGVSFWRGAVAGDPGSRVFLSLSARSSLGWVRSGRLPGGIAYLLPEDIDPEESGGADARLVLAEQLPSTGKDLPAAYCAGALPAPEELAGGPGAPSAAPLSAPVAGGLPPPTGAFTAGSVRLAIETDYQFFQRFGNLPDANAYVTQMIAAIGAVYLDEVHTTLSIAYLGLHSTSNDGWSAPDGPGTPGQLLDEFRAAWAPSLGGSWPVSADVAHFISGASLGGGIAYIDVLCNPNFAFGVSAVSGNIDWDAFTGAPSGGNWDFIVVAHEIGHNFSALHTHDYCPPVDRCQSSCSGSAICSTGTLMSYCHLCSGVAGVSLGFGALIANEMRQAATASCAGGLALGPGESVTYELRFDPVGSPGARSATLRFDHDGTGTDPFQVVLTGTAQ